MAEITQIKLPNNTIYDIVDATCVSLTNTEFESIWDENFNGTEAEQSTIN